MQISQGCCIFKRLYNSNVKNWGRLLVPFIKENFCTFNYVSVYLCVYVYMCEHVHIYVDIMAG